MKHIGLITEYNPFHNGHHYQLNQIKKQFPEKNIIIIMSGNYVQRGEPAIFNKYLRTTCALQSGADIIFELPSLYSSASAEHFASASVLALSATGIIDTLCFGSEDTDINLFTMLAELLLEEPLIYQNNLKTYLKNGMSFPKARCQAIASYLHSDAYTHLLKQPNNILGIEYIKIIQKYKLDITPVIIKRIGSGYHDLSFHHPLCSASALRHAYTVRNFNIKQFMPDSVWELLSASPYAKPLFLSDFYAFLQYALWQKSSYYNYFEITKEFSNRLNAIKQYPSDIEELISQLSCKNMTDTRIKRCLLNILLNHQKADMDSVKEKKRIPYLRLLGFRNSAAPLIKEMKNTCTVPIINKVSNAKKILLSDDYFIFQKELCNDALYQQAFFNKYHISMPSEYEHSVIIKK